MTHAVLARRGALSSAILIAGCLLLAACSNSGGNSASSGDQAVARPAPAGHAGAANGTAGYGAASGASAGTAGSTALTAGLTPTSESIIYTASMTVRTANVAATARRISSIVVGAGGYTSDEHLVGGTPGKTGEMISITLKIPVPAYEAVLAQLSSPTLGKQIAMQQQATDVTEEVANVSSLVTSEQDAITALQGLLNKAGSVAGLLQVQQQISADESTLNSLLAQQRALDQETSYATVAMTLQSPVVHKVVHRKAAQHGFVAGLTAGWRSFKRATSAVLTGLGAALPFLVVIVVVAGVGYAGRRRFVRRKPGPTAAD